MMREKPLRQIVAGEQGKLIQEIRFVLSAHGVTAASKIDRIKYMISKHDTEVKQMIERWFIMQGEQARKEATKQ